MSDTNVGLGMVACRKNCWCPDCQIDRLRARVAELESERDDWRVLAKDNAKVLAAAQEQARDTLAENARLRAALEAAPKMAAVFRDSDQYDYWFTTTRAEALK